MIIIPDPKKLGNAVVNFAVEAQTEDDEALFALGTHLTEQDPNYRLEDHADINLLDQYQLLTPDIVRYSEDTSGRSDISSQMAIRHHESQDAVDEQIAVIEGNLTDHPDYAMIEDAKSSFYTGKESNMREALAALHELIAKNSPVAPLAQQALDELQPLEEQRFGELLSEINASNNVKASDELLDRIKDLRPDAPEIETLQQTIDLKRGAIDPYEVETVKSLLRDTSNPRGVLQGFERAHDLLGKGYLDPDLNELMKAAEDVRREANRVYGIMSLGKMGEYQKQVDEYAAMMERQVFVTIDPTDETREVLVADLHRQALTNLRRTMVGTAVDRYRKARDAARTMPHLALSYLADLDPFIEDLRVITDDVIADIRNEQDREEQLNIYKLVKATHAEAKNNAEKWVEAQKAIETLRAPNARMRVERLEQIENIYVDHPRLPDLFERAYKDVRREIRTEVNALVRQAKSLLNTISLNMPFPQARELYLEALDRLKELGEPPLGVLAEAEKQINSLLADLDAKEQHYESIYAVAEAITTALDAKAQPEEVRKKYLDSLNDADKSHKLLRQPIQRLDLISGDRTKYDAAVVAESNGEYDQAITLCNAISLESEYGTHAERLRAKAANKRDLQKIRNAHILQEMTTEIETLINTLDRRLKATDELRDELDLYVAWLENYQGEEAGFQAAYTAALNNENQLDVLEELRKLTIDYPDRRVVKTDVQNIEEYIRTACMNVLSDLHTLGRQLELEEAVQAHEAATVLKEHKLDKDKSTRELTVWARAEYERAQLEQRQERGEWTAIILDVLREHGGAVPLHIRAKLDHAYVQMALQLVQMALEPQTAQYAQAARYLTQPDSTLNTLLLDQVSAEYKIEDPNTEEDPVQSILKQVLADAIDKHELKILFDKHLNVVLLTIVINLYLNDHESAEHKLSVAQNIDSTDVHVQAIEALIASMKDVEQLRHTGEQCLARELYGALLTTIEELETKLQALASATSGYRPAAQFVLMVKNRITTMIVGWRSSAIDALGVELANKSLPIADRIRKILLIRGLNPGDPRIKTWMQDVEKHLPQAVVSVLRQAGALVQNPFQGSARLVLQEVSEYQESIEDLLSLTSYLQPDDAQNLKNAAEELKNISETIHSLAEAFAPYYEYLDALEAGHEPLATNELVLFEKGLDQIQVQAILNDEPIVVNALGLKNSDAVALQAWIKEARSKRKEVETAVKKLIDGFNLSPAEDYQIGVDPLNVIVPAYQESYQMVIDACDELDNLYAGRTGDVYNLLSEIKLRDTMTRTVIDTVAAHRDLAETRLANLNLWNDWLQASLGAKTNAASIKTIADGMAPLSSADLQEQWKTDPYLTGMEFKGAHQDPRTGRFMGAVAGVRQTIFAYELAKAQVETAQHELDDEPEQPNNLLSEAVQKVGRSYRQELATTLNDINNKLVGYIEEMKSYDTLKRRTADRVGMGKRNAPLNDIKKGLINLYRLDPTDDDCEALLNRYRSYLLRR